jgi:hypothetical protein
MWFDDYWLNDAIDHVEWNRMDFVFLRWSHYNWFRCRMVRGSGAELSAWVREFGGS